MEKQALRNEADALQSQLDLIKQRLSEIDSSATAK
jgi:prefoldin subunit 5